MDKILKIIDSQEDKNIIKNIVEILTQFDTSMTPIQIYNFVLNDVEYPTAYGKFVQAQQELYHKLHQLIDLYYQIEEKRLQMKRKEINIEGAKDDIEREIHKLQKEKLEFQIEVLKSQVKKTLKEIRIFYSFYQSHPEFHNLTEEERMKLDAEQWRQKTMNMPDIFYQRYGKEYMGRALGEDIANMYIQIQRKTLGLLPREFFEIIGENNLKAIKGGENNNNENKIQ